MLHYNPPLLRQLAFMFIVAAFALLSTIAAAQTENAQRTIVGQIVEVKYSIEKLNPPNLVVTAIGNVPKAGYSQVRLNRVVYVTPPRRWHSRLFPHRKTSK